MDNSLSGKLTSSCLTTDVQTAQKHGTRHRRHSRARRGVQHVCNLDITADNAFRKLKNRRGFCMRPQHWRAALTLVLFLVRRVAVQLWSRE
ncbi:hypothetical protein BDW72DRAFT_186765 [Aspergillus terricola var. indicus]